jgi:hypothetical protein
MGERATFRETRRGSENPRRKSAAAWGDSPRSYLGRSRLTLKGATRKGRGEKSAEAAVPAYDGEGPNRRKDMQSPLSGVKRRQKSWIYGSSRSETKGGNPRLNEATNHNRRRRK